MKRYGIFMTETAAEDLQQIAEYIAMELREPDTARKQVGKIKEVVMGFAGIPTRHASVTDERLDRAGHSQAAGGKLYYVLRSFRKGRDGYNNQDFIRQAGLGALVIATDYLLKCMDYGDTGE